jgi:hypothetical protein
MPTKVLTMYFALGGEVLPLHAGVVHRHIEPAEALDRGLDPVLVDSLERGVA